MEVGGRVSYLGGVIVGALVAFPAAAVDPGDTRQTQLALVDLQGLVFDHVLQSVQHPPLAHPTRRRTLQHTERRQRSCQLTWDPGTLGSQVSL